MDADTEADAIWRFNEDLGVISTSRKYNVEKVAPALVPSGE